MLAREIYETSDGAETKKFYALLEARGLAGALAVNLFRAQKSSARAKVYRGGVRGHGSYRGMAYDRKDWALRNLCHVLSTQTDGVKWGWRRDPNTPGFEWVLYLELPQGQVSFHSAARYEGPDYAGEWDGQHMSAARILAFCDSVLERGRC